MLAWRLIRAKKDGDYSAARFMPIDARVKKNFQHFDKLVSSSFAAFSSFEVWNAWHKIWFLGSLYGCAGVLEAIGEYNRSGAPSSFDLCEVAPYAGVQASEFPEYMAVFDAAAREVDAFAERGQSPERTASAIYDAIAKSGLWPKPWPPPQARHVGVFTLPKIGPLMSWVMRDAPEVVRKNYPVRFQPRDMLSLAVADWGSELKYAGNLLSTFARDFVRGYNRDWSRS
jgi:FADH2 O2-dependent halogenase